ncbi:beta-aspartyl-peptidase [Vibrio breoganii]|uniref:beta-aspartyl-peptidase n=1 Tax=Vibrio breoganii TaxID=553239 RepID=UPI000C815668|nr:beta-aspartyl-peptidase [Vibrio breoganii]PMG86443.1 beta-aspartyl-peptidase [Vibrio breoganii]PML84301.1 beta-aspartyl-peptidase [Vibrio breoganii]PMM42903.1 beta-aspartyl-peptidase [Vibrio breoganii]PMO87832.1 beta-aspartyl-peptidase [Vibrio breoganii]PMP00310.1 beta-aspartyl-peptidase [Vibrio breoganii]
MQLLIKNGSVHAPQYLGKKDLLCAGGKIIAIEDTINESSLAGEYQVIDAKGANVVPGFVDTHQHFIGGGGEGGYATRTPELKLTDQTLNGVTTALGLLGTDDLSRHVESLFAKTMGFRDEGISTYMITGSYFLPSPTITGSVMRDIAFIDPVVGVKLAVSDHRGPYITHEGLADLVAQVRNAALVSGKAGIITVHAGAGKKGLTQLLDVLDETDYQAERFVPTHINREDVWEQAVELAKRGAIIDGTAVSQDMLDSGRKALSCAEATQLSIELGIKDNFTFSSDAGGSLPKWNEDRTRIVGMGVGTPSSLLEEIRRGVNEFSLSLSDMLVPITKNAAKQLGLSALKGELQVGHDADVLLLNDDLALTHTVAKGRVMVSDGEAVVKGTFE